MFIYFVFFFLFLSHIEWEHNHSYDEISHINTYRCVHFGNNLTIHLSKNTSKIILRTLFHQGSSSHVQLHQIQNNILKEKKPDMNFIFGIYAQMSE